MQLVPCWSKVASCMLNRWAWKTSEQHHVTHNIRISRDLLNSIMLQQGSCMFNRWTWKASEQPLLKLGDCMLNRWAWRACICRLIGEGACCECSKCCLYLGECPSKFGQDSGADSSGAARGLGFSGEFLSICNYMQKCEKCDFAFWVDHYV